MSAGDTTLPSIEMGRSRLIRKMITNLLLSKARHVLRPQPGFAGEQRCTGHRDNYGSLQGSTRIQLASTNVADLREAGADLTLSHGDNKRACAKC